MLFEQIATGGCQSYLLGCGDTHAAVLIDPALPQIDHYAGPGGTDGLRIRYVHGHPHPCRSFLRRPRNWARLWMCRWCHAPSAPGALCRFPAGGWRDSARWQHAAAARCTHRAIPRDSMCLVVEDRVFTGDTLLIGGTGRTDLPTGDPDALYDSLFNVVLKLPTRNLKVYPAHDYKGRSHSTIGAEIESNPRLQKRAAASTSSR